MAHSEEMKKFSQIFPIAQNSQGQSLGKVILKNNKSNRQEIDFIQGSCVRPNKGNYSWIFNLKKVFHWGMYNDIRSALKKFNPMKNNRIVLMVPNRYFAYHQQNVWGLVYRYLFKTSNFYRGGIVDSSVGYKSRRVTLILNKNTGVLSHELGHTFNQLKEFYKKEGHDENQKSIQMSSYCHRFIDENYEGDQLYNDRRIRFSLRYGQWVGFTDSLPYKKYELIPCPSLKSRGLYYDFDENNWVALSGMHSIMSNENKIFFDTGTRKYN